MCIRDSFSCASSGASCEKMRTFSSICSMEDMPLSTNVTCGISSKKRKAQKLSIHYNTLTYRLGRIKEIAMIDLEGNDRFLDDELFHILLSAKLIEEDFRDQLPDVYKRQGFFHQRPDVRPDQVDLHGRNHDLGRSVGIAMSRLRIKEGLARALFVAAAGISLLAVALICVFLFANGVPAIDVYKRQASGNLYAPAAVRPDQLVDHGARLGPGVRNGGVAPPVRRRPSRASTAPGTAGSCPRGWTRPARRRCWSTAKA